MAYMINFRSNVRGFLFQGRFSSFPVYTDNYLLAAVRYIEQNPVKAGMTKYPLNYKWSSAGFHCGVVSHAPLVKESSLLSSVNNWREFLSSESDLTLQLAEKSRTGRPFGPEKVYSIVEQLTGCNTRPGLPGRPKKKQESVPWIRSSAIRVRP